MFELKYSQKRSRGCRELEPVGAGRFQGRDLNGREKVKTQQKSLAKVKSVEIAC